MPTSQEPEKKAWYVVCDNSVTMEDGTGIVHIAPAFGEDDNRVGKKNNIPFEEVIRLEDAMPDLDVLYMTRVQRERFFNEEDYIRLKDSYILDLAKLENAKEDLTIMHPLPRVNEISVEVDDDPRACYFFQALCGKHIRMALILKLLGIKKGE